MLLISMTKFCVKSIKFRIGCYNCEPGFYTLKIAEPCKACPTGALCLEGVLKLQKSISTKFPKIIVRFLESK